MFSAGRSLADDALLRSQHGNGAGSSNGRDRAGDTDHIVIEVVHGKVRFSFDAGSSATESGAVDIVQNKVTVTDNEWHYVTASRTATHAGALSVDDATKKATNTEVIA